MREKIDKWPPSKEMDMNMKGHYGFMSAAARANGKLKIGKVYMKTSLN